MPNSINLINQFKNNTLFDSIYPYKLLNFSHKRRIIIPEKIKFC